MNIFPPALLAQAKDIRALLLDVDGVLTDGGLYFTETGETSKRFNTLDGHGLKLLQRAGIQPVIITGRDSAALRVRLNALNIQHAHFGVEDKRRAALSALQSLGLSWAQTAAMGDDWPDLPMLLPSTLAMSPEMRLTSSIGVPAGAQMPNHSRNSKPGTVSATAGTSGSRPLRRWLLTPTAITLLSRISGRAGAIGEK